MRQHVLVSFFASFVIYVLSLAVYADSEELEPSEFQYTYDYTTRYADAWTRHLSHLKNRAGLRFLEVGTYEGRSAVWFLENHPDSEIVCIDTFSEPRLEERFDHNIRLSGQQDRVKKVKGYSQQVLRDMRDQDFDVIYIDGCHSAWCVYQDLALSWPLLKRGGILILDDYTYGVDIPPEGIPKTAIDPFLVALSKSITVLEKGKQVIVRKER